ncbi:hypothetical protein EDB19DRAFT_1834169 [Suillus lakei]|nr:hypothetical protein EDB19DRAFT_1834169 [Suillus lakei]
MDSLLKIPLILSSPLALHVSTTPPHTPTNNDVVHYNPIEWFLIQDINYGLPLAKNSLPIASRVIDPKGLPSGMQHAAALLQTIQDVPINNYHFLTGTALIVAGGLLRWWCFRTLGRFFTFHLSVRKEHTLVTTGTLLGRPPSILSGSVGAVHRHRMTAIIGLMFRIDNEDKLMKSIAKDEWVNWAKKVKYRLIPGIY